MPRLPALVTLVCSLVACGAPATLIAPIDAGAREDAETVDAGELPIDGASTLDGGHPDDAQVDASAIVDAHVPADARADASSSSCPDDCPLVPAIEPTSCSDRWHTCRIMGCTTYCGEISSGSFPAPRGELQTCDQVYQCDRGLGCLGLPLLCRAFCRISEGDTDCIAAASRLHCSAPAGPLMGVDGPITLPPGIGVCSGG